LSDPKGTGPVTRALAFRWIFVGYNETPYERNIMFIIDLVRNTVAVVKAFSEGFVDGSREQYYIDKMQTNLKNHTGTLAEDYDKLLQERNRQWSKRHRDHR